MILDIAANSILLRLQLGGEERRMNFTPIFEEVLVSKAAPADHKNTKLEHCHSPDGWKTRWNIGSRSALLRVHQTGAFRED
jgi:hypothetical protein